MYKYIISHIESNKTNILIDIKLLGANIQIQQCSHQHNQ